MNWEQLRTILWLRWRLTRNQGRRAGGLGGIITLIVMILGLLLGVFAFGAGIMVGWLILAAASPNALLAVWSVITCAFLFFWMIGLLTELQRTETIDLQRLMHLPVVLRQVFTINFIASHFVVSLIIAVPGMTGLAIGLAISRGPSMLLLIPLALAMVFMISAWTYCLRGWLAGIMTNPRKRRSIIMGITMAFILVAQAPNIFFNVMGHAGQRSGHAGPQKRHGFPGSNIVPVAHRIFDMEKYVPPLWLAVGARGLAEKSVSPALLGMIGYFALGSLGLRRAYRLTVLFYHGGDQAMAAPAPRQRTATAKHAKENVDFMAHRIPFAPEPASALAMATLRSMIRAPEVKMALGSSLLVSVIICASVFTREMPHEMPGTAKPFVATGVLVFAVFMLIQFLSNQFGFDREGFRTLVLSPVKRHHILLGKNLACAPFCFAFGVALLTGVAIWLRMPASDTIAAMFQLVALVMIASLGGNLLSIFVPYRIQAGSMKPTKVPALAMITLIISQMFFPLLMLPVFVPPLIGFLLHKIGIPAAALANLLASAILAAVMALVYGLTLAPIGRAMQRRESKILLAVTSNEE